MKEINLTQEPNFGEEYKDVIFKLRIIKAIVEGDEWGKSVLKFVDPNTFTVQVGGLNFILGIIKELYMQTSKIPSIEIVKETIYNNYIKDDIDKQIYDAVFKEYDKIRLDDEAIKQAKNIFKDYYVVVSLKKLRENIDSIPKTNSLDDLQNTRVYVKRIIKTLEELKFYYENTDNSTGIEVAKEW